MKHLLLLGGGHSHIEVLRRLGREPCEGSAVTLVDPASHAVYSGMLPGVVAGLYTPADCRIDLAVLAAATGARFHCAAATGIDPDARRVTLSDGGALDYDALSIDVGSIPAAGAVEDVGKFTIPVKPADALLAACAAIDAQARDGAIGDVVVVGGGAAGVEIAFALQQRLRQARPRRAIGFALISDQPQLLPGHHPRAQRMIERIARARGIALHLQCRVLNVDSAGAVTDTGRIEAGAIVWATGPAAPSWLADCGLALDARGFISIDSTLQSVSAPAVFAAGDCASVRGRPHPKSGVYAVRQGPILAENLRRWLQGRALIAFKPQARALALLSTADHRAVASYGPLAFEGAWVWRWKDRIDRTFVAKYRPPEIQAPPADQSKT